MDYNTTRDKLILPEYGRLVQSMAEYAIGIKDRNERQRCAETIIRIMANFSPQNRNTPGLQHKLWNHLALLTDYKLDVDYPFPIERHPENEKPVRVPYPMTKIQYRHYGHLLENLLHTISEMPEGAERDELMRLTETRMRRSLEMWNKDSLNDSKIHADMQRYINNR